MKTTIVYNHPYEKSYNHAILEASIAGAQKAGSQVQVIDLDAEKFNPVMTSEDLLGFVKHQQVDPQAQAYSKHIGESDHLILIFPIWWELMPAMMKGFIDKVIFPGAFYDYFHDSWKSSGRIRKIVRIGLDFFCKNAEKFNHFYLFKTLKSMYIFYKIYYNNMQKEVEMKDSNLQAIVISLSLANNWEEARQEWTRVKLEKIDKAMESKCLCGKAHLQKVYSISRTDLSNIKLSPIGSSCIKKFQNKELTKSLKKAEREYRLRSNSDFSSLKEIMDLDSLDEYYQKGYFKADRGNRYNPWNDYQLFKLALSGKQSERQLAFHKMERILYVVNDYLRPELNQVFDLEAYLKKLRRWKLHERVAAALRKNALEREKLLAKREREAERERQRQLDLQRWAQKKQDLLAWLDGQFDEESIALKNSLDSQTEDREICHKIVDHQKFLERKEAQERLAIAELERKQARVKSLCDWLHSQNRLDDLKTVQTIESLDNQLFMLEKWHSDYVHHRRMEQRQQDELLCVVLELRRQVKKYYPYTERAKKCIEFVDSLDGLQEQRDWLQRFLKLMKKSGF